MTALHYRTLYVCCAEKNMFFFMFVGVQRDGWRVITGLKCLLRCKMVALRVQVVF